MNTQVKIIIVTFMLNLVYQQGIAQWQGPGVTGSGNIYLLNGKVGIGTSNPSNVLHLEKPGNTFITLKNTATNGSVANFGTVSTNGKVETQLQYQTEFGIRDNAASAFRFKILANGFIGIGYNSPLEKLHINGNIRGNQAGAIRIKSPTGYVDIGSKNENWAHFQTDRAKIFLQKMVSIGDGILSSHDTKDLLFNTGMNSSSDGITRIAIKNSNGNVGIGTTNPLAKLQIVQSNENGLRIERDGHESYELRLAGGNGLQVLNKTDGRYEMTFDGAGNVGIGTIDPNYKLEVEKSNAANNTEYLLAAFNHTGNAGGVYMGYVGNGTDAREAVLRSGGNINLNLGTSAYKSALTINNSDGNVGIGTESPDNKLEVNGIIRSKEILVEASPWPDYVFAPEYNLRSLTDTKAFIEENHHLPGIPSAEEVDENGIAVGDMQAKLLQKIEELTLYILDLEERMESLEQADNQ